MRIPLSRLNVIASNIFWCKETITHRGVVINVNPGQLQGYYLYFFGTYYEKEIDKIIELCKGAHIFADVGASVGIISLVAGYACQGLECFAFEPERNAVAGFHSNLSLNPELCERIHVINKAVAHINGSLLFQPSLDRTNLELGRIIDKDSQSLQSYFVPAVRLDTFFAAMGRYPDIIKIDVEGAELYALQGMDGIFDKGFPRAILLEVHPFYFSGDSLKYDIEALLLKAGFTLFYLTEQGCRKLCQPEEWPKCGFQILAIRENG